MRTPLGPVKSVLIGEVSLFQGLINTHLYCIGTQKSVLIIEVSLFQGVLISNFHCTCRVKFIDLSIHTFDTD